MKNPREIAEVYGGYENLGAKVQITQTEVPSAEARLAIALIERWGMVVGIPDGEDTAGRSKLNLMRPSQIVERAFITAQLTYQEIEKRGWFVKCPTMEEARDIYANRKNKE
jgi:hypothetical protein